MFFSFLCREGENIDAGTETNSNLYHEVCYHFLGTDQSEDILCWKDPENPKYMFSASVMDDGKVYIFLCLCQTQWLIFVAVQFICVDVIISLW